MDWQNLFLTEITCWLTSFQIFFPAYGNYFFIISFSEFGGFSFYTSKIVLFGFCGQLT